MPWRWSCFSGARCTHSRSWSRTRAGELSLQGWIKGRNGPRPRERREKGRGRRKGRGRERWPGPPSFMTDCRHCHRKQVSVSDNNNNSSFIVARLSQGLRLLTLQIAEFLTKCTWWATHILYTSVYTAPIASPKRRPGGLRNLDVFSIDWWRHAN